MVRYFCLFFFFFGFSQESTFKDYNQKIAGIDFNLEMVAIPSGTFKMGSPNFEKNRLADEGPVHEVYIDSFWIGKFEITWDLYQLFMQREIDSKKIKYGDEINVDVDAVTSATTPYVDMTFGMGSNGYPAISMTQLAASKFCEWLSAMTGNYYRLPTEAEWEYAARGGIERAEYPWGGPYTYDEKGCFLANFKPERGDYAADQILYTAEAESYWPNDYGLYNMSGNVSEWTDSNYEKSANDFVAGINPNIEGDNNNSRKVVRGGSWKDVAHFLKVSTRDYEYQNKKRSYIGFRTVQSYLGEDVGFQENPNKIF